MSFYGVREKYLRYTPPMIILMGEEHLRLLHRLRRRYREESQTPEECVYFRLMIECVNQKLLSLECLCGDCMDEWDEYPPEVIYFYFPL